MQITTQLAGRVVQNVVKQPIKSADGQEATALVIRCEDGRELSIGFVDENGNLLKGTPIILFAGLHVVAKPTEVQHRSEARIALG